MLARIMRVYKREGLRGVISRIKREYKRLGIRGGIIEIINRIGVFISKESIWYRHFYRMLGKKIQSKKYVQYYQKYDVGVPKRQIESGKIPVFVCWFQGMENAPDIVKACYRKLQSTLDEKYILITLDINNYLEYVTFPDFVLQRIREKRISWTHLSDIMRTYLVVTYGGLWIDSTMLLEDTIPDEILRQPLFVFRLNSQWEKNRQLASNQFIYAARPQNEILKRTLLGLYLYWKSHKKIQNYYIYHYLFAIAVNTDAETKEAFMKIPFRDSRNNHVLHDELLCEYNEERYNYIMTLSFVHKLTYKIEATLINEESNYVHVVREAGEQ